MKMRITSIKLDYKIEYQLGKWLIQEKQSFIGITYWVTIFSSLDFEDVRLKYLELSN